MQPTDGAIELTENLCGFIDASPTPYHAVDQMVHSLRAENFIELDERNEWKLTSGGKYFVKRHGAALVAFTVGHGDLVDTGFRIIATHTDSPALVLKPVPLVRQEGYLTLSVQPYGGGLWATWLNRDLGLAGRIVTRTKGEGALMTSLVQVSNPPVMIPMLAIHLTETENPGANVTLDLQANLPPMLGLETSLVSETDNPLEVLLRNSGFVQPDDNLVGLDLQLFEPTPATFGGVSRELIFAPRLDNLASCHSALSALLYENEQRAPTCVLAAFDNEEVGSVSARGAQSNFLMQVLKRIADAQPGTQTLPRALAASMLVSADMAHALHPNYVASHEPNHKPILGVGPVLKVNANERYATTLDGRIFFEGLCARNEIPCQVFAVRAGARCGSTVGPALSAMLGIPTIDIGNPMLSMHASRECAAVEDHLTMTYFMEAFYDEDHLSL